MSFNSIVDTLQSNWKYIVAIIAIVTVGWLVL